MIQLNCVLCSTWLYDCVSVRSCLFFFGAVVSAFVLMPCLREHMAGIWIVCLSVTVTVTSSCLLSLSFLISLCLLNPLTEAYVGV